MNVILTEAQVIEIRRSADTDAVLAARMHVSRLTILRARTGQTFPNVNVSGCFRRRFWKGVERSKLTK